MSHAIRRRCSGGLAVLACAILLAPTSAHAQSAVDGFNPGANGLGVLALAEQPNGRIVVGGGFTMLGGGGTGTTTRNRIGRLYADGSLDASFNPGANGNVNAVVVQPDGMILVAGEFTMLGGGGTGTVSRNYIARLNADGSLDTTFNPGATGRVVALALQPNGQIVVAGFFTGLGGGTGTTPRNNIGRLNADGSVDSGFDPGANAQVGALAIQADGKILVGGSFTMLGGGGTGTTVRNRIGRVNSDGTLDSSFNPGADNTVLELAVQPDENIVVTGSFTGLGGGSGTTTRSRIGRLNADGSVDAGFNPGSTGSIGALAIQPDGRILVGGYFTGLGGGTGTTARKNIGRILPDGSVDPGFNPGTTGTGDVFALVSQMDGKILVGGYFTGIGGGTGTTARSHVARLYADGTVDANLIQGGDGSVWALAVQGDDKILVGGDFTVFSDPGGLNQTTRYRICRLKPDGSIDTTFNPGANNGVYALAVQPDGKILVGGLFTGLGGSSGTTSRRYIGRLNPDGTVDGAFNPGANGFVSSLVLQSDGKILVAGNFTALGGVTGTTPRQHIGRLNPDGSVDATFNPGANNLVAAVAVQSDGAILVGGMFSGLGGGTGTTARSFIGRLNAVDGSVDSTFNPGANNGVWGVVVEADGRILLAGAFTGLGGGTGATTRNRIGRLSPDGTVDAAFNPGANSDIYTLALQADGRILVGGSFSMLGGGIGTTTRNGIGRLEANGVVDTTFNPGSDGSVFALAGQRDGKILAGGNFTMLGGGGTGTVPRSNVGRLTNTGAALQRLAVTAGGSALTWSRGGTAPEFSVVNVESSADGVTYTPLGTASRIAGGWQVTGLSLPTNQQVYLRVRGAYQSGTYGGSRSAQDVVLRTYISSSLTAPLITAQPGPQTIVAGGSTTFTAAASGLPLPTYHWELSTDFGATWSDVPNAAPYSGVFATTLTITGAPQALNGAWYRAVATNSEGSATSTSASLTVTAAELTELVGNGSFAGDTTAGWKLYATPDMSYIVSNVTNGVFQYYRVPPPAGTTNQAVIFYETGAAVVANAPLVAHFDLGNSSSVRKRISVLVIDANFSDIAVCTFWIPPGQPLTPYTMKTHTTKAAANAAIYFYAASPGSNGGYYLLDNVSLQYAPAESHQQTTCIDPTAPTPPGGSTGPNLLTNGDFETGQLTPWGLYGQITSQIVGGVFEFYRPAGTPAGVVLQNTNQAMTANEILTANFQLGNSSPVRKRVTVLVHDNDFLDLSACTFYLNPGQPLSNYALRTFATKAWTNATISVYPATVGTDQWIRLDNVSLQRTPSATITGTECAEPGTAPLLLTQAPPVPPPLYVAAGLQTRRTETGVAPAPTYVAAGLQTRLEAAAPRAGLASDTGEAWRAVDRGTWAAVALASESSALQWHEVIDLRGASRATLTFLSRLTTRGSWAEVELRADGGAWLPVRTVLASDDETIAIDLSPFVGSLVEAQWIVHGVAAPDGAELDTWQVSEVNVEMAAP